MKRRCLLLFVILISAPLIVAAQEAAQEKDARLITGNHRIVGEDVELTDPVEQDLVIVGNSVTVKGAVGGDVIAIGQRVVIDAPVAGNIRVVGGDVLLNASVGKNATILALRATITQQASVGWSTVFLGDSLAIDGTINGMLEGWAERVVINGTLRGASSITVGASGIAIGKNATVGAPLTYTAPTPAVVEKGAQIATLDHRLPSAPVRSQRSLYWPLVFLFGAWVVGAAIVQISGSWLVDLSCHVYQRPGKTIVIGIAVLVLVPVVSALLLATMIGIPLALIGVALYFIVVYLTKIVAGTMLGIAVLQGLGLRSAPMVTMLVGVFLYSVLLALPVAFGAPILVVPLWTIGVIVTLGSIVQSMFRPSQQSPNTAPAN